MIYEEMVIIGCRAVHALVVLIFLLLVRRIRMLFSLKKFYSSRAIIPQNFSSSGLVVPEELGNKQTHRLTHSLTSYCFYRVILIQCYDDYEVRTPVSDNT